MKKGRAVGALDVVLHAQQILILWFFAFSSGIFKKQQTKNNKPAPISNRLTMSLEERAIRLPPGDTSRIRRSCQPGWPSLARSCSSSS